jgi:hypothetical protein
MKSYQGKAIFVTLISIAGCAAASDPTDGAFGWLGKAALALGWGIYLGIAVLFFAAGAGVIVLLIKLLRRARDSHNQPAPADATKHPPVSPGT